MADSAANDMRLTRPLALAAGAVLASCGVPGEGAGLKSEGPVVSLRPYIPPPAAPPSASIGERVLERANALWWIDGNLRTLREDDENRIPVNEVDATGWKPARITVRPGVVPSWLNLRYFSVLNEQGIPASDIPDSEYECGSGGPCRYAVGDDELIVDIEDSIVRPGVFVLEAEYITAEKEHNAAEVGHLSCSWAFRVH